MIHGFLLRPTTAQNLTLTVTVATPARRQGIRLDVCEPTVPTGSSIDTPFSTFAGSIHHSMSECTAEWMFDLLKVFDLIAEMEAAQA